MWAQKSRAGSMMALSRQSCGVAWSHKFQTFVIKVSSLGQGPIGDCPPSKVRDQTTLVVVGARMRMTPIT